MFLARWVDAPRGRMTVYPVEPVMFDDARGQFVPRPSKTWAFSYGVAALAANYSEAVEAVLDAGRARA
jgi:hypothetical protein